MEMARMKVNSRDKTGSRFSRQLRKQGLIPGVIYGHGEQPQSITLQEHEVELALQHGERLLEVELEGQKINALVKDVQHDTFGIEVIHVDLARVNLDERVEVTVPIILRGTPAGAADDGVLQQIATEVSIECVVTDIPDEIRTSVADLGVGQSLHMSDLKLPTGAKLLDEPEAMVCAVSVVAEEQAPAETEEGAEPAQPEVLGERKETEENKEA